MNFSKALELLKGGKNIARQSWPDPRQFLGIDDGEIVIWGLYEDIGWRPGHGDLLAEDWEMA